MSQKPADKIIIVEDEPNIAESLTFILGRAGYDVHCVADGDAAIFEIQNHRPNLVILDVMLPGRSGIEILHDIRKTGANDYMVKPFSNEAVVARVKSLLE